MIVSSPIWPHNASPCLISRIGPYLGPPFALHVRTFSATDATRERSHAWMSYERFQGVIPRCCGSAGCDRACESWPQSILHLDPHNPPCSFQSKEQIRALKAQKKEPVQVSVWPLSALQAWHGVHAWRWLTPLLSMRPRNRLQHRMPTPRPQIWALQDSRVPNRHFLAIFLSSLQPRWVETVRVWCGNDIESLPPGSEASHGEYCQLFDPSSFRVGGSPGRVCTCVGSQGGRHPPGLLL